MEVDKVPISVFCSASNLCDLCLMEIRREASEGQGEWRIIFKSCRFRLTLLEEAGVIGNEWEMH